MLSTLLRIGEWQRQGKSEWDRYLSHPKIEYEDRNGNIITNYTLPIVFDLDEMKVEIEAKNLKDFDQKEIEVLKALKIQGGNNKAIYPTVPSVKLIQLYKTFFGKENEETSEGELIEAIRRDNIQLLDEQIKNLLSEIFKLKTRYLDHEAFINPNSNKQEYKSDRIALNFELNRGEQIVLIYAQVKGKKHGLLEPVPFSLIPQYVEFITSKFLKKEENEDNGSNSLCYASGEISNGVKELGLSSRYSLNKMFVTETRNYASSFNQNLFNTNYQVSTDNQEKLDYASNYLLNEGNYKVRIANIDHVILPQFLHADQIDLKRALTGIKAKSDILFNLNAIVESIVDIQDETEETYWINFIAFESDGNFFKSTEVIKDVNRFHFEKILKAFSDVHHEMREAPFVDWNLVMTNYGESGLFFNCFHIYSIIPLRKDKEKKNKALDLLKSILENRKINSHVLFDYFCELILCHFYERYSSYTNIAKSSKDYFGITVRNCVFKYHAFIQVLKKLNLVDMEEATNTNAKSTNKYDQAISDFFVKMNSNEDRKTGTV